MKANCDWECQNGHRFEKRTEHTAERLKCPECGSWAERVWLSPRSPHRQFSEPIVIEKYADGSFGFPGRSDRSPSKGAERIEIRSGAEYRRLMGEFNSQERERFKQREEKDQEFREAVEHMAGRRLTELLRREENPLARDILKAGIEMRAWDSDRRKFLETYCEVMELDRGNRD